MIPMRTTTTAAEPAETAHAVTGMPTTATTITGIIAPCQPLTVRLERSSAPASAPSSAAA